MDWMFWLLPAILLAIGISSLLRARRKRKAERVGRIMAGTIRSIVQTGTYSGSDPELRMQLDVKDANGVMGQATLVHTFLLTQTPHVGSTLAVVLNPDNPAEAFLANATAMQRDDRTATVLRDTAAVPAEFRNNPPQVGDIVAIMPVGDGTDNYQVNVVRLGQEPAPVFCQQTFPDGHPYGVGDRVYLVTDSQTPPRHGYIMPLSFSGGQKLLSSGNRADALLGDALQFSGAKAKGTVENFSSLPMPAAYTSRTVTKWSIDFTIHPEDGTEPYRGTTTLAMISADHVAQVNQFGKVLPLRYDPYDKPTFVVDGIALGFGEPAMIRQQMKQLHLAEQGGV